MSFSSALARKLRQKLLDWYETHGRKLPWRASVGDHPDPYKVWLSEIMLQQTTVAAVEPYFRQFTERWPAIKALADAELDDILHGWQGLGYYARARNLHRCARVVRDEFGGVIPDREKILLGLPGIGSYTAAAVLTIAFNKPANVVDGNVERVMSRIFEIDAPLPGSKPRLRAAAEVLAPSSSIQRPGDYAQALMDLGATVCVPRKPRCGLCPWRSFCKSYSSGTSGSLPRRERKPVTPVRFGIVYWVQASDGSVLLRRRPESGLLGGMMEFPSTEWRPEPLEESESFSALPASGPTSDIPGVVRHVFSHFQLELLVKLVLVSEKQNIEGYIWCKPSCFANYALPTVMKKVAKHSIEYLKQGNSKTSQ